MGNVGYLDWQYHLDTWNRASDVSIQLLIQRKKVKKLSWISLLSMNMMCTAWLPFRIRVPSSLTIFFYFCHVKQGIPLSSAVLITIKVEAYFLLVYLLLESIYYGQNLPFYWSNWVYLPQWKKVLVTEKLRSFEAKSLFFLFLIMLSEKNWAMFFFLFCLSGQ